MNYAEKMERENRLKTNLVGWMLRHGISLNKKYLNRKVRHSRKEALRRGDYKRICKTLHMVEFS